MPCVLAWEFFPETVSWEEAYTMCRTLPGHLARLDSRETAEDLFDFVWNTSGNPQYRNPLHIGLRQVEFVSNVRVLFLNEQGERRNSGLEERKKVLS